ncbi:MAG TPA: hypothetical protein VE287_11960 [Actinopolymorphaceae bacterium]|nr:hypothetical protein [Actinopolymorphaceae bacterium]
MSTYAQILEATKDVVLHNWPTEDVPNTLAGAGYAVTVYGGPRPDDIYRHELRDGKSVVTRTGTPPTHADLVYVLPWPGYVQDDDLPRVAAAAKAIGASTLWYQSARSSSGDVDPRGCWMADEEGRHVRQIVEAAGLRCIDDSYIADEVRAAGLAP